MSELDLIILRARRVRTELDSDTSGCDRWLERADSDEIAEVIRYVAELPLDERDLRKEGRLMEKLDYRKVKSRSRENVIHTVTIVDDETVSCTCEKWKFNILRVQPYVCPHMTDIEIEMDLTARAQTTEDLGGHAMPA